MVVNFSNLNLKEKPTLVLKNLDGVAIQTLGYAFNVEVELCYNEVSTLTFDLPESVDGSPTPHYSDVTGMRMIDLVGVGLFVLVDPSESSDGVSKIKSCKAYSLEYLLQKKNVFIEAGTFNFYDGNTSSENTIVGIIHEIIPEWSWSIDSTLLNKYRTFEDTDTNIYDFMKNTLQEPYGCIFDFNTYNKIITVVSVNTTVATKPVYLSENKLLTKVQVEENSDDIVTCLSVSGADDVSIRSVNPIGTDKIYDLSHFLNTTNLSQTTIDAWEDWVDLCDSYRELYFNTTMEYNLKIMQILTEEAALSNIENEYVVKDNERAVIVAGISSGIKEQSDLDTVNTELAAIQTRIDTQEASIQTAKTRAATLQQSLATINTRLDFDNPLNFTSDQIASLRQYFIEGSLQDSTFATSSAATYTNEDVSSTLTSVSLAVVGIDPDNYRTASMTGYNIDYFTGGSLSISTLSADVISGTVQYVPNSSGDCIFTAYLNSGTVGSAEFESGTITLTGTATFTKSGTDTYSLLVSVSTGNMYFTRNTSDYEQHEVEWDLYEYGEQVLAEKCVPVYEFSVTSGNFLRIEDYVEFHNSFELGKRVYLNINDTVYNPYVISTKINFEDMSSFSITFSSSYSDFDSSFALAKLLDQSVSMGKTLDINSSVYSEFVTSGAPERLQSMIDDALDLAKNAVMSSGEQAVSFDDAGLRLRKWSSSAHTGYDSKQIWAVNNVIAFTDDNWSTAKMAIGEVFDKNLGTYTAVSSSATYDSSRRYYTRSGVSPDYVYTLYTYNASTWDTDKLTLFQRVGSTEYGIVAPYIVGTLLAGQNLLIDTSNGSFKVDESGVYIDSLKFYISHGGSSYSTTLSDTLDEVEDLEETIDDIIDSQGYVKADAISGVIDTTLTSMSSSDGNVLFDDDGIWLLNTTTKSTATQAIWMNDQGIRFGSGTAGDPTQWTWTTGIGHDGVIANSMIAATLSGHTIVGGSISIGAKGTTPESYNFTVDSNGDVVANNLTANNGTFSGTVKATSGLYLGNNSVTSLVGTNSSGASTTSIDSDYLNLKGLEVKNGNVTTMKIDGTTGVVTLGSDTVFSWGNYTTLDGAFDAINSTAADAAADVEDLADGDYSGGTFISGTSIYSPNIYSNLLTVTPRATTGLNGGIVIQGRGTGMETGDYSDVFTVTPTNYGEGVAAIISGDSWIFFDGSFDFSNATVTGISTTAIFG